jgi:hypothetical protein
MPSSTRIPVTERRFKNATNGLAANFCRKRGNKPVLLKRKLLYPT